MAASDDSASVTDPNERCVDSPKQHAVPLDDKRQFLQSTIYNCDALNDFRSMETVYSKNKLRGSLADTKKAYRLNWKTIELWITLNS